MTFGQKLRTARENQGVDLDKVASATKISRRYLQALENDEFDGLPGDVFIKGYVRAIAQCIGVDAEPLVADFVRQRSVDATPADGDGDPMLREMSRVLERSGRSSRHGGRSPLLAITLGVAGVIAVVTVVWVVFDFVRPESVSPPTPRTTLAEARNPADTPPAGPAEPARQTADGASSSPPARPPSPPPPTAAPDARRSETPPPRTEAKTPPPVVSPPPPSIPQPAVSPPPTTRAEPPPSRPQPPPPSSPPPSAPEVRTSPPVTPPPAPATTPATEPAAVEVEPPAARPQPPPPPPRTPAVAPSEMIISEFGVGADVVEHGLVGEAEVFHEGTDVWFWTRVLRGIPGQQIRHVWIHEGQVVSSVELEVGSNNWRTQSRRKMTAGSLGGWDVEARDKSGRLLARSSFVCVSP